MYKMLLVAGFFFCMISSCTCHNNESSSATKTVDSSSAILLNNKDTAVDQSTATTNDTMKGMDTTALNTGAKTEASSNSTADENKKHRLYKTNGTNRQKYTGGTPGEFPEGSDRLLTDKDVKFLSQWGLKVMLNEIYARHGMIFTDPGIKQHFRSQSWYHGAHSNIKNALTPVEKQNVEFIRNYKFDPAIPA